MSKELTDIGQILRTCYCAFGKFNSSGRCIACCHFNIDSGFQYDCLGRTVNTDYDVDVGQEVELGRRKG